MDADGPYMQFVMTGTLRPAISKPAPRLCLRVSWWPSTRPRARAGLGGPSELTAQLLRPNGRDGRDPDRRAKAGRDWIALDKGGGQGRSTRWVPDPYSGISLRSSLSPSLALPTLAPIPLALPVRVLRKNRDNVGARGINRRRWVCFFGDVRQRSNAAWPSPGFFRRAAQSNGKRQDARATGGHAPQKP